MNEPNEKQAIKWVKMARETAKAQMGSSADLLTLTVQNAMACAALVSILAGQEIANGATMIRACELIQAS